MKFFPLGLFTQPPLLFCPRYPVYPMTSRNSKVEIFTHASPHEQDEALENLRRYLQVVVRIYDSIQRDPELYKRLQALTEAIRIHRIDEERSNITQSNNRYEA